MFCTIECSQCTHLSCAEACKAYSTEMEVVMRRSEWLAAVLESEEALTAMFEKLRGKADDDVSAAAGSRDMGAVARAGPCQS